MTSRSLLFLLLMVPGLSLKGLDVSVTHATFQADNINYVEVYFQIIGKSVQFHETTAARMQAEVHATVVIQQEEEIEIAERLTIRSPEFEKQKDFVEMRRYVLPNGSYTLKVEFADAADADNQIEIIQDFDINFDQHGIQQSDLRLLSSYKAEVGTSGFHRNGYFLEPLPFNYYHRNSSTLIFYNEVYGSDEHIGEDFMVTYSILRPVAGHEEKVVDFRHKRLKPMAVNVLLAQMDISGLASGNYLLKVEVKNKSQDVLAAKTIAFSRSNPLADLKEITVDTDSETLWVDTLSEQSVIYALRAVAPILSGHEVETLNYLLAKSEAQYRSNFLHHVWSSRYGQNAEVAYGQYMEVANALHIMFRSGFGYGFETDRGRVYLKYGRPDQRIEIEDDQGAYPYEIWYYNKLTETGQSDVRFLFYNPSLATNDYLLLTSTCRGERSNPRWEVVLYRNSAGALNDNAVDASRVQDGYRRRARELYED